MSGAVPESVQQAIAAAQDRAGWQAPVPGPSASRASQVAQMKMATFRLMRRFWMCGILPSILPPIMVQPPLLLMPSVIRQAVALTA